MDFDQKQKIKAYVLRGISMNNFYKISIICLILILCSLFGNSVSAEGSGYNILNPAPSNDVNPLNPLSSDENNVLNPISTNDINVLNPSDSEEVSVFSETQTELWQGQTSPVYKITLNCPGTVRLSSSYGAQFNIYAKKNGGSGSCPDASSIRYNYDKVAYGYSGSASMTLESGIWCLMVYGYSGSGSYSIRVTSNCQQPYPTATPTPYPNPCGVYKTDNRQGFLNQGQAAVFAYSIPSDGRSKIDWSMTSAGSCGGSDTPVIVASAGDTSTQGSGCTGSSTFDLYVFKDCNPKSSACSSKYYSYGPNSFISVANPSSGSYYYAMIYARSGSGTFNLKMNSYKCIGGDTPIIAASVGADSVGSTASGDTQDTGAGSEVSAPTAEFIQSSDSE